MTQLRARTNETSPMKKKWLTFIDNGHFRWSWLLVASLGGLLFGCDTPPSKAKLALGPEHSASHQVSNHLLAAYDIDAQDIGVIHGRFDAALEDLKQGRIDIAMGFFGLPSRNVDSLQAATGDLKLVSLSDAVLNEIEKNSGYRRFTIPKASYLFLEQDVHTLAASAVLMANTQTVSDELAYQLASVMYQQGNSITHSQAPFLTLAHALEGGQGLRIHPGAKRFYEDQGLTVNLAVAEINLTNNKQEFILGSGSQGGTYYPLGGELVSRWNQFFPSMNITSVATDGSLENLSSLAEGKLDLSMTVNISALDAQAGTGHFTHKAVDNAAFIGQLYPEVFHIISRASNPISSFSELPNSQ